MFSFLVFAAIPVVVAMFHYMNNMGTVKFSDGNKDFRITKVFGFEVKV
jgi:hypothetical protein